MYVFTNGDCLFLNWLWLTYIRETTGGAVNSSATLHEWSAVSLLGTGSRSRDLSLTEENHTVGC